jgi:hypothetical protein
MRRQSYKVPERGGKRSPLIIEACESSEPLRISWVVPIIRDLCGDVMDVTTRLR